VVKERIEGRIREVDAALEEKKRIRQHAVYFQNTPRRADGAAWGQC
jgi:hypothetical protein